MTDTLISKIFSEKYIAHREGTVAKAREVLSLCGYLSC